MARSTAFPRNNEVMFLLYNKSLFSKAGLDPNKPPATWADLAAYSKTIHDKTGAYGFGLCAQQTNGNTSYRFMPSPGPTAARSSTN